jgi:imidazoleglycerol-phosphate dehydratase
MLRSGKAERKTKETDIAIEWFLDGRGKHAIKTGIPFFNHMLELFSKHGFFDLTIRAKGDIDVDLHHTIEDVGIAMGAALRKALPHFEGIRRYGYAIIPMDETLCMVAIDLGGRPLLVWKGGLRGKIGTFDTEVVREFFKAFANEARCSLHINIIYGDNRHHKVEATFKAFAKALHEAVTVDKKIKGVLSTKGTL